MQVVYHSFGGRCSDNPRAVYEALRQRGDALRHVWVAAPSAQDQFPAGVQTVAYGSDRCRAALEQADVVVSNTHLELEWDKAPHTRYLQTWHGTPLKRIHADVLWDKPGRLAGLDRDVRRWDALLSPNPPSTRSLRSAFRGRFDGEIIETGYPRNDVLSAPDRDEVRARVRHALDIDDDAPVVLYAPTWRDDLEVDDVTVHLDLDDLAARLPGHVVLLRLHHLVAARRAQDPPRVRDVSTWPQISELYLAADVLVTDYSSAMFDFAVTGKPVVLFAYDLEHYRDRLRGFYLALEQIAPGPLVRSSAEVVDALADLDGVRERYAQAYARFRETFCALEDGRATERVLERWFPVEPAPQGALAVAAGSA